eukprot:712371-Pleurochrysis_carterae.AAC.1
MVVAWSTFTTRFSETISMICTLVERGWPRGRASVVPFAALSSADSAVTTPAALTSVLRGMAASSSDARYRLISSC